MADVDMAVETVTRPNGYAQLRRRWQVESPLASILIVHGIGEHSGRYEHVGRFFAGAGYDVEAFDNRGFGQSGGRPGHVGAFSQYLDDIEDRLEDRRRIGRPTVLFGHSLGGLMVANYLIDNRPQPDLAILSSPALEAEVPRWQRAAAPVLGRVSPTLFIPSEIDSAGLSRDIAVQKAYEDDPLRVPGATAGMGLEVFKAMKTTTQAMHRLAVPTYVLHGEKDPIVPIEISRPLADLPNVTYRSWPGLLHECLNEPEQNEVMAEIDRWLTDQLQHQTG